MRQVLLLELPGRGSVSSEVAALAQELRTTEAAAGSALSAASTPEQAADTFGLMYERYFGPPQPERATQARAIYDRHLGSAPVSTPVSNTAPVAACGTSAPGASGTAAAVIAEAAKWFGTPYSWGGGTLDGPSLGFAQGAGTVGFDCSSYTRYAFFHGTGLLLPRTAAEQFTATAAHTVATGSPDLSLLQAGDLLFWGGQRRQHSPRRSVRRERPDGRGGAHRHRGKPACGVRRGLLRRDPTAEPMTNSPRALPRKNSKGRGRVDTAGRQRFVHALRGLSGDW